MIRHIDKALATESLRVLKNLAGVMARSNDSMPPEAYPEATIGLQRLPPGLKGPDCDRQPVTSGASFSLLMESQVTSAADGKGRVKVKKDHGHQAVPFQLLANFLPYLFGAGGEGSLLEQASPRFLLFRQTTRSIWA